MPVAPPRSQGKKTIFHLRGKSAKSVEYESIGSPSECGEFLHIGPALTGNSNQNAQHRRGLGPRAHSTLGNCHQKNESKSDICNMSNLQAINSGGHLQIARTQKEREKFGDRISLDRRGLTSIPAIIGEPELRLLSLQHNLLTSLSGLSTSDVSNLVFLDVYDNQIDKISFLEGICNLRVLLMGKNRIRYIEGLSNVKKLEVLDLHGNRITQANGLNGLNELKVLNLAGNQLKTIELSGLPELRELNLKRNHLKKLTGCDGIPKIQKLFLNNNDLQCIDDILSLASALSLREVTLDNNPVSLGGECISFLVSYLPNLCFLSQMQVTEQVRRAAMSWRRNKETNSALSGEVNSENDANIRREQIISNARTNWELLRSENKCSSNSYKNSSITPKYNLESNNPKCDSNDILKNNSIIQQNKNQICFNIKNNINNQNIKSNNFNNGTFNNACIEKQKISNRSTSQDTDVSHSTSSSEFLKLPPILVPIIDSIEHQKLNSINDNCETSEKKVVKRWESISSVDPVFNSSMSSLLTTSDSEADIKINNKKKLTANKKRATFAASKSVSISESNLSSNKTWSKNRSISDNSENMSVVSNSTNLNSTVTNSSTSGSDITNRQKESLSRAGSVKGRHIKSATTIRKNLSKQIQNRAVTAKPKPVKNTNNENNTSNPVDSSIKEREQGSDWLVEVRSSQASIWGAGALRRLERGWPTTNDVTSIHFHYVNFGNICPLLAIIKNRFPNATNFTFRACGLSCTGQLGALAALRGITSLVIHRDGNPLAEQSWHSYALYRLAHWGLCSVDHKQVTDDQIMIANEVYAGLSEVVLWSLPDSLLQPLLVRLQGEKDNNCKQNSDKDKNLTTKDTNHKKDKDNINDNTMEFLKFGIARCWLWNADPTLRDVVAKEALQWRRTPMSQEEIVLRHRGRTHLSRVLCLTATAAFKLKLLKRHWPSLLLHLLTTILYDFSQMETHIDNIMRELQSDLCAESLKKT